MQKRRISNEEIGKVLVEYLDAHTKTMEKNIQKMNDVSAQIEQQIQKAKQLKFEYDLNPIKQEFEHFSEKNTKSVEAVKKTMKTPNYLWYTMAVMSALALSCIGILVFIFSEIF